MCYSNKQWGEQLLSFANVLIFASLLWVMCLILCDGERAKYQCTLVCPTWNVLHVFLELFNPSNTSPPSFNIFCHITLTLELVINSVWVVLFWFKVSLRKKICHLLSLCQVCMCLYLHICWFSLWMRTVCLSLSTPCFFCSHLGFPQTDSTNTKENELSCYEDFVSAEYFFFCLPQLS